MTSPVTFILQTWDELKKVTWPTQEQIIRLTMLVIFVSVLIGVYIGAIDYILTEITRIVVQ